MKKLLRIETVAALAVSVLSIGIFFFLNLSGKDRVDVPGRSKEFGELKIVQFYLHLPGGDMIIGRDKKESFETLADITDRVILNIEKELSESGSIDEKDIQDIKSGSVSLSTWLIEPQKISTGLKGSGSRVKDKYGNYVIVTDRILFVLGGEYLGTVFVRNAETGAWKAWQAPPENMRQLADIIKAGGL